MVSHLHAPGKVWEVSVPPGALVQLPRQRSAPQDPPEKSQGKDADQGSEHHIKWAVQDRAANGHRTPPDSAQRLTWNPGSEEVEKLPVFGVHDRSLYELHHRLAAVFKLGVAPQAKGPFQENREGFMLQEQWWEAESLILTLKLSETG